MPTSIVKLTTKCSQCDNVLPTKNCVCGKVSYCEVTCQKLAWPKHKRDCPAVVLKEVEGKGLGLVTTRKIKAGQVLLSECPIITHNISTETSEMFQLKFQDLPQVQKKIYLSLYDPGYKSKVMNREKLEKANACKEEEAFVAFKVWRILCVNAICIDKNDGAKVNGVYAWISRINHSCMPNVVFGVEAGTELMTITSCREIGKNEEVLLNYILDLDVFNSRQERQAVLEENWYFSCECDVCCKTGKDLEENEEIRKNIMICNETIRSVNQAKPIVELAEEIFALTREKLQLMEKIRNEVVVSFPFALIDCYGQAKTIECLGGGVADDVDEYLKKAVELCSLLGPSIRRTFMEYKEEKIDKFISKLQEMVGDEIAKMLEQVVLE